MIHVPESHIRFMPGPGQYKIESKFDQYRGLDNIAKKLIKKLNRFTPKNKKTMQEDLIRQTYDV